VGMMGRWLRGPAWTEWPGQNGHGQDPGRHPGTPQSAARMYCWSGRKSCKAFSVTNIIPLRKTPRVHVRLAPNRPPGDVTVRPASHSRIPTVPSHHSRPSLACNPHASPREHRSMAMPALSPPSGSTHHRHPLPAHLALLSRGAASIRLA
jgi:hypothetical protein